MNFKIIKSYKNMVIKFEFKIQNFKNYKKNNKK